MKKLATIVMSVFLSAPAFANVYLDCGLIEAINGEMAFTVESATEGSAKVLAPLQTPPGTADISLLMDFVVEKDLPAQLRSSEYPSTLATPFILDTTLMLQYNWATIANAEVGSKAEVRFAGLLGFDPVAEKLSCSVITKEEYNKLRARF